MVEVERSVEVGASCAHVWDVLADFPRYAAWHPAVGSAAGSPLPGARLVLRARRGSRRLPAWGRRVTVATPGRALEWQGPVVPGLLRCAQRSGVEPSGADRSRLVQRLSFSGPLARWWDGGGASAAALDATNRAVASRAEARARATEAPAWSAPPWSRALRGTGRAAA